MQAEIPQHKVAGIAELSLPLAGGQLCKGCSVVQWKSSGFKARHADALLTDAHLRPDPCCDHNDQRIYAVEDRWLTEPDSCINRLDNIQCALFLFKMSASDQQFRIAKKYSQLKKQNKLTNRYTSLLYITIKFYPHTTQE